MLSLKQYNNKYLSYSHLMVTGFKSEKKYQSIDIIAICTYNKTYYTYNTLINTTYFHRK